MRRQLIREETHHIKKANADAKRAFEEARANHLSASDAATNLTLLVKSPSRRNSAVEKDVDDFDEHLVVKACPWSEQWRKKENRCKSIRRLDGC